MKKLLENAAVLGVLLFLCSAESLTNNLLTACGL